MDFSFSLSRFSEKIRRDGDCWIWTAARSPGGYGFFKFEGRQVYAHRWAYEDALGSIPPGLTIDHTCRNPSCVNPDHLEAVTMRENILRSDSPPAKFARRDSCAAGHPYTPENTGPGRKPEHRVCRACGRDRQKKWRQSE